TARAGPAPKIEGSWEGALDVCGTTLRLVVKIAKAADGGLTATLDSPDQGRSDMPVTSIAATETDVRFDLKYFGAYFEGKLNKELSEMTGNWYQGGASIPLVLKKAK
ncbi:MAG TPA: alpha/beta hydrolase, partial [Blastocatellia bacterium]|nr:alpha/beta hydrolase [Blastocatellia bacterium]